MFSSDNLRRYGGVIARALRSAALATWGFMRENWKGLFVIGAASVIYFAPFLARADSYNPGGDAMMNAWILARDQHCILRQNCPDFTNGNIYFPHEDSMLYSEVELSSAFLTLPLHFINPHPLFVYTIWTVASFFFMGFFMYLLAKRLSGGREFIPIVAGLAFEFSSMHIMMWGHLQNLTIFYLPLIMLFVIRFLDTGFRRYLVGSFIALVLLFYGSWYQMVFGLIALTVFLLALWVMRTISWRQLTKISVAVVVAGICVSPLALQYVRFSKTHDAKFEISEQLYYSSSVADYVIPPVEKTVWGEVYRKLFPDLRDTPYNTDSPSYHGITLYITALGVVIVSVVSYIRLRRRKRSAKIAEEQKTSKYVWAFAAVAFVGFIFSFGPALKLKDSVDIPGVADSLRIAVAMPWLAVDLLVPQLQFIRSIGRITVVALFGMLCILAFLPIYLERTKWKKRTQYIVMGTVALFMAFEFVPLQMFKMCNSDSCNNLKVPAVYEYIASHKEVDNIIILRTMRYYPDRPVVENRMEDMLWAGYHNKNIFNGYSGYEPPEYWPNLHDFLDLSPDDPEKMKKLGLRYVLIDKKLSEKDAPLITAAEQIFPNKVYEDKNYTLYRIQ